MQAVYVIAEDVILIVGPIYASSVSTLDSFSKKNKIQRCLHCDWHQLSLHNQRFGVRPRDARVACILEVAAAIQLEYLQLIKTTSQAQETKLCW